jgi:hypothetical protein
MPQAQPNIPTEIEAALEYARGGWPVFPCNPLDKSPVTSHSFKDATTDEAQIRAWWTQWPNAMIGAPTGGRLECGSSILMLIRSSSLMASLR